ncbi:hypothetical protein PNOK_0877900 [Pyrrhoderma noxium]|uniref:DUF6534 domain-containing protein n=1 Tax=Pyrrhoderma noxium TaxID=2282107 RepID=A0A286U8L8_9AGAM|nr:hypothetical protein PNOK_0877900 [Pyrrhoderma noxium]
MALLSPTSVLSLRVDTLVSPIAKLKSWKAYLYLHPLIHLTFTLWGMSLSQLVAYFRNCSLEDSWKMKCYVPTICICDTIQQFLIARWGYRVFVREHGNDLMATEIRWDEPLMISILSYLVEFLAQLFYVRRVWLLSRKKVSLTIAVCISVAVQYLAGCLWLVENTILFAENKYIDRSIVSIGMTIATYSITTLSETLLVVIFSVLLRSLRSGSKKSDSIIGSLVLYTISTGGAVALVSTVGTVLSIAFPGSPIHLVCGFLLSKVRSNSLLVLLNSRNSLKCRLDCDSSVQISIEDKGAVIEFARNADRSVISTLPVTQT